MLRMSIAFALVVLVIEIVLIVYISEANFSSPREWIATIPPIVTE